MRRRESCNVSPELTSRKQLSCSERTEQYPGLVLDNEYYIWFKACVRLCVFIWVWEGEIRYLVHVDIVKILQSCEDLIMTGSQDGRIVTMTEICLSLYRWWCSAPGWAEPGNPGAGEGFGGVSSMTSWEWAELPQSSKFLLKVSAVSLPSGAIPKSQWKPSGLILVAFLSIIKGTSMGWI